MLLGESLRGKACWFGTALAILTKTSCDDLANLMHGVAPQMRRL